MGLPRSTFYRSTFYDVPAAPVGDVELDGYRRVRAEFHQGFVVNGKKIRRLMRGLQPKRRRRYVITTNSDHESPIFPDLARRRFEG